MKFQKQNERSERRAELHSAVSQICNLRRCWNAQAVRVAGRFAECNSAIRQIKNLRYAAVVTTSSRTFDLRLTNAPRGEEFVGEIME